MKIYFYRNIGLPLLKKVAKDTKIDKENLWGGVPIRFYGRQPC